MILFEEQNYRSVFSVWGGLAPILKSNEEAINILVKAIEKAGYTPGKDILIYMDIASNNFFIDGKYILNSENKELLSSEMVNYIIDLVKKYPIYAIEDAIEQEDCNGWSKLTNKIGQYTELVGDDLFVTNPTLLQKGIKKGIANAIIIKVNQIGTLTEAIETIKIAKKANYNTIISGRSGESEDPFLAHLFVGLGVNEGKIAGLRGAESTSTLNELIKIEETLGNKTKYSWLNK